MRMRENERVDGSWAMMSADRRGTVNLVEPAACLDSDATDRLRRAIAQRTDRSAARARSSSL
jgi:hypothetical protein